MAQVTSLERKNNNRSLTHSGINIFFKRLIHPALFKLAESKINYKVIKGNDFAEKQAEFSEDRPIIFVCNHTTSYDIPIALRAIKKHTILFAGKQPLEKIDELFFNLNGTIYVDRKNKEDMKLSKQAMIETLNKKRNILVFPEGTWSTIPLDTSDATIMHEMKWGIIEVAQEANAIIVPMGLNYDYDKRTCKYVFGEPFDPKYISLITSINEVRDSIATIRWNYFEENGMFKREDINVEEEREKRKRSVEEYPKLDYDYEQSIIFHRKPSEEEVFAPIKKLRNK